VSQLGCRHLSPTTNHASTSGETSSTSQVLLKGSVVRVFLVRCLSVEPWVCPFAKTNKGWPEIIPLVKKVNLCPLDHVFLKGREVYLMILIMCLNLEEERLF
jgi:hypothetical protein